jgi:hypothetical protein
MVSPLVQKEKALAQGKLDPKHQERWHGVLHKTCDSQKAKKPERQEKVAFKVRLTEVQRPTGRRTCAKLPWPRAKRAAAPIAAAFSFELCLSHQLNQQLRWSFWTGCFPENGLGKQIKKSPLLGLRRTNETAAPIMGELVQ